jgi:hypothetical protein
MIHPNQKPPKSVPFTLESGEEALHHEMCLDVSVSLTKRHFCTIYLTNKRLVVYKRHNAFWGQLFGLIGMLLTRPDDRFLLNSPLTALGTMRQDKLKLNKNILVLEDRQGQEVARLALYRKYDRWVSWLCPPLKEKQAGPF